VPFLSHVQEVTMSARSKIPALVCAATLGALAAPAFAAVTYYAVPEDDEVVYYAPTVVYVEPPITVRARRATEDELITDDVSYRLATNPRLSGKIGVETERRVVTLTGRVTTPGQVDIASREARSVDGVDEVQNYLRTRVGGG
jgi:hypothetical protein